MSTKLSEMKQRCEKTGTVQYQNLHDKSANFPTMFAHSVLAWSRSVIENLSSRTKNSGLEFAGRDLEKYILNLDVNFCLIEYQDNLVQLNIVFNTETVSASLYLQK